MQTIKTADGHIFPVLWCGVSGISGQLFADVTGEPLGALITVFDNPVATETIIYNDGRTDTVYRGYTRIVMCGNRPDGSVRVCLERPVEV